MSASTEVDLVWVINGLLSLLVLMIGVIVGNMWLEIKELRKAKHNQNNDIAALKILVVGDYIKRTELTDIMRDVTREVRESVQHLQTRMDSKFSDLHDEIHSKADKN